MKTYRLVRELNLGVLGHQKVEITFTYSPGRPAVMYLRNGDPGYPEEPAEVEITSLNIGGDTWIDLMSEYLTENDDFLIDAQEAVAENWDAE